MKFLRNILKAIWGLILVSGVMILWTAGIVLLVYILSLFGDLFSFVNLPALVTENLYKALGYLFVAWVIYQIYKIAYEATLKKGFKKILFEGFLYCAGIALLSYIALGQPTCIDKDPIYGDCYEYADDGFTATTEQKLANFMFYFTLFFIPVAFGSYKAKNGYEPKEKSL